MMRNQTPAYLLLLSVLAFLSGCATQPAVNGAASAEAQKAAPVYLQPPTTDCEIRKWYNYQVVAIPVINQRWIETGLTPQQRAQKAFEIRHNARINARYMMADKQEVQELRRRDQQKYGNPDGPTFPYLVQKIQGKGTQGPDVYKAIIQSSSRTNPMYNDLCEPASNNAQ